MKILIVKLSAIGDVIHTLPALNAIRKHYPEAHITWLVEEAASEILIGHPAIDRVLISRRKTWIRGWRSPGFSAKFRDALCFLKTLQDTRYDLIIDFQALLKSGILIALAKGKRKIGFDKGMEHMELSHLFLNERIAPVSMEHHALLRQLMLVRGIGIEWDGIEYRLPVEPEDKRRAGILLAEHGVQAGEPLIIINPGAKWKTKLWSSLKFARLADAMIERRLGKVIFTGSEEDKRLIDAIRSSMKDNAADLSGKTTLKTLAAVFEKAKFLISTDTGPMHLAAALGLPVIALFGPTAPWRTGPFGSRHRTVRAGLPCSPCFKRECGTVACMSNISLENVLGAVDERCR